MKTYLTLIAGFGFLIAFGIIMMNADLRKKNHFLLKPKPILEVRNLESKIFRNDKLSEKISYKHGYLEEPNQYIIRDSYAWKTFNEFRRIKKVVGNKVIVEFEADSVAKTIAGSQIKDVEFQKGFKMFGTDYELKSESATFYYPDNLLLGTEPVYIYSEDTRIHSSDGFKVLVDVGDFELFGNVNGVIRNGQLFENETDK